MKHILPVLTVTALAAAASAQVAPAPAAKQAISYDRIVASWVHVNEGIGSGISVTAQGKIGAGLYVSATTTDIHTSTQFDGTAASLGYIVALPHVLGMTTDLNIELGYKSLGAGIRSLIGGGLEFDLAYAHGAGSEGIDTTTVGLSYNLGFLAKGLSINASYGHHAEYSPVNAGVKANKTTIGIAYNF